MKPNWFSLITWVGISLSLALYLVLNTAVAASSAKKLAARVPSCSQVGSAIKETYASVSSIDDITAHVKQADKQGRSPVTPLRYCKIHVSGHKRSIEVKFFNGSFQRGFLKSFAKTSQRLGLNPKKLTGRGYGDLAYLMPNYYDSKLVEAVAKNMGISVTTHASAKKAKAMMRKIVELIK